MQQQSVPWEQTVEMTLVVVGCIIPKDGKYLFIQERQERAYGLWNIPAGHVDKDETLERAAIREAKEETGYDVEIDREIGIYHEEAKRPVKHAYQAHIVGGEAITSSDEIIQVKWLTYDEIKALNDEGKIRSEWVWKAINIVEASLHA